MLLGTMHPATYLKDGKVYVLPSLLWRCLAFVVALTYVRSYNAMTMFHYNLSVWFKVLF